MTKRKLHFAPLLLTAGIVLLDQLTKLIIIKTIPMGRVGASYFGDFFIIRHARNLGVAFSIGDGSSPVVRILMFIVLPVLLISAVIVFLVRSEELTEVQRWLLAGIAGGGIGNVFFDRIFRPQGVVDFLDFRFFGIFGLDRWPTYNVADAATVVSGTLLAIVLIREAWVQHHAEKAAGKSVGSEKDARSIEGASSIGPSKEDTDGES